QRLVLILDVAVLIQLEPNPAVAKRDDVLLHLRAPRTHPRERLDVRDATIKPINLLLRLRPRGLVGVTSALVGPPHRRQLELLGKLAPTNAVAAAKIDLLEVIAKLPQVVVCRRLTQLDHELIRIEARIVAERVPRLRRARQLAQLGEVHGQPRLLLTKISLV